MDGAPARATGRMNTWETMEAAIPRGEAERIAALMGCSVDYVRRWRREPEGNDNGTGRRDPLAAILILLDALYARNPQGAELIVARINDEMANLRRIHGRSESFSPEQVESALRQVELQVSQIADAVSRSR